jgi:hypothetical protein
MALGRPNGEVQDTVKALLDWARENHRRWFYRYEPPTPSVAKKSQPVGVSNEDIKDEGPPPRHSPMF